MYRNSLPGINGYFFLVFQSDANGEIKSIPARIILHRLYGEELKR